MGLLTYSSLRALMLNSHFLFFTVWFQAAELISISGLASGFTTKKTFSGAHCPLVLYGVSWHFITLYKDYVFCFLASLHLFSGIFVLSYTEQWDMHCKNND